MNVILTILYTVIIFLLLIFIHEFGHFFVAKLCKARVEEFSLGMGPLICQKQKGETMYSLRWLPIGGYCLLGGEEESTGSESDFVNKKWWQKVLVLAAGAIMNIVLCILIMASIALISGTASTTLSEITPDSPAEVSGLMVGDTILEINGNKIESWADITTDIGREGNQLNIIAERDGKELEFSVIPEYVENEQRYVIGIKPSVEHSPGLSLSIGAKATWNMAVMMVDALKTLIIGKGSPDDLSGPVGIVRTIGESAKMGFVYVAYIAAIISLNLAIINLLPFPALDGGRILFVIIRLFTGKKVTDEVESKFHFAGMALLMVLLVLVTFNDVGHLISH